MLHNLDRPVWHSLLHSPHLAEGGVLAKRFRRDVNILASASNDSTESLAALSELVCDDESVLLIQVPEISVPADLVAVSQANGVQMLAERPIAIEAGDDTIIELDDADATEMLALAQLTTPGPFLPRTHTMGRFVGVRVNGQLVAMAGERMRFPGFTEVSAVCTHPEFRGRGLARRVSSVIVNFIQQRAEQPFLHSWSSNIAAIALYESLGFKIRATVNVAVLKRKL